MYAAIIFISVCIVGLQPLYAAPIPEITECHGFTIDPQDFTGTTTYRVAITKDGRPLPILSLGSKVQWECQDLALVPGSSYRVEVVAVNAQGPASAPTSPLVFTWLETDIQALKVCLDIVVRIKGKPKQLCLMVE